MRSLIAAPPPPSSGHNALAVMAADLAETGWTRHDGWFAAELCAALREDALAHLAEDQQTPARIGREQDRSLEPGTRHCGVIWLSGGTPAQSRFLERCEALRIALNQRLFLGLMEFEACYAAYPPGGYYGRHLDSFRGAQNRIMSLVLFLNPNWTSAHGGELVIHLGETPVSLPPRLGEGVLMLSEEIEHEVRPTRQPRLALAAWWRVNQAVVRDTPLAAIVPR